MTTAEKTTQISDRELVLTRVINAPPEKVFKAWTDPELLKQWFAPLPYTTPIAEIDLRPGGSNLIVMRGPDGSEMPNRGVSRGGRERAARLYRCLHEGLGAVRKAVHDGDPDVRERGWQDQIHRSRSSLDSCRS